MGTRHIQGFRTLEGDVKASYCHWDGYPAWKGKRILEYIKNTTDEGLEKMAQAVKLVNQPDKPTADEIKKCLHYGYLPMGKDDTLTGLTGTITWYEALHNIQDGLDRLNLDYPIMTDDADFLEQEVACEYGYIVNVRDKMLEFYSDTLKYSERDSYFKGDTSKKLAYILPFDEIRIRPTEDLIKELEMF